MPNLSFEFDFVISYAGEDTAIAEKLHNGLTEKGAKVFYAPEYLAQLWGENQFEYLADIYSKKGIFCIPLISSNYVRKQWTQHEWRSAQERALKSASKAYILPVRLDDSPLPDLLETIGYIEYHKIGIEKIILFALEKLNLHKDGASLETPRAQSEVEKWKSVPSPFQRNQFLIENNYLNRKSKDFGINALTTNLWPYEDQKSFLTLVTIPIPDNINIDVSELSNLFDISRSPYGVRSAEHLEPMQPWMWFDFSELDRRHSTQSDLIKYKFPNLERAERPFTTIKYVRFDETGAIEYAASKSITFDYPQTTKQKIFNYVYILGAAWRFTNFTTTVYNKLGYNGKFQLLINLVNTQNTLLGNFACDRNGRRCWPSPVSGDILARMSFEETNQGICLDSNLQFAFDVNGEVFFREPGESENIMVAFSKKLQQSFNYVYAERHYMPDTKEFPWHQFSHFERY